MIDTLLSLPIAGPILLAALAFLFRARRSAQRACSLLGAILVGVSGALLLDANFREGIQVTEVAHHPAPFGIVLVADALSSVMTLVNGIVGFAVALYRDEEAERSPVFHPLLLALLAGTSGAFLTGDLFNFYVWFEIAVASSLGLLVLGGRAEQIDAGIKYAVLNVFAASVLLLGIGLVYASAGTLNFADLARTLPELSNSSLVLGMALTLLVALGCKAAIFPLYFWLPASYHTGAFAVGALLSGVLTKVGVYALYRVFLTVFPAQLNELRVVFFSIAALTMVTGVLGAADQGYRRGCCELEQPLTALGPYFEDPAQQVGETIVLRIYLCPGCATNLDSEVCRPGDQPFEDVVLDADAFRRRFTSAG